jgi:hypothetical protein
MNHHQVAKPLLLGVAVSLFFVLGWRLPVVVYLPLAPVLAGALTALFVRGGMFDGGARAESTNRSRAGRDRKAEHEPA